MDDCYWLRRAIALAHLCPPSETAFSVGAVVVQDGNVVGSGYSRQHDPRDHAEEVALRGVPAGDLSNATVYSSLEPCGARASRPLTCAELIIRSGIGRVVYAWGEPDKFVIASGRRQLEEAGIDVVQIPDLADSAARPNRHLLDDDHPA